MWELFLQNIAKKGVSLSNEEIEVIQSLFSHKKLRKNQYILQQGDVARYETFVVSGLTRTYEVDNNGLEHVLFFGPEDWWVGDLYSFLSGKPSLYNVDCLEATEVLQISRENLDRVYELVPKNELLFPAAFAKCFYSFNATHFFYLEQACPATLPGVSKSVSPYRTANTQPPDCVFPWYHPSKFKPPSPGTGTETQFMNIG